MKNVLWIFNVHFTDVKKNKKLGLFKVILFAVLNVWLFFFFYKLLIHFLVSKTACLAQSN